MWASRFASSSSSTALCCRRLASLVGHLDYLSEVVVLFFDFLRVLDLLFLVVLMSSQFFVLLFEVVVQLGYHQ